MSAINSNFTVLDCGDHTEEEYKHLYGPLADFYMLYLGVKSLKEIREVFCATDNDVVEELSYIPDEAEIQLQMDYVTTGCFSIGGVKFMQMFGEPVIFEENASPVLVWGTSKLIGIISTKLADGTFKWDSGYED